MLSIIICSRAQQQLTLVEQNLLATVGVPYEVIALDNSKGRYGICEAYNIGAAQARYELLCFMHEDIRFHTPGWGGIVARHLADPTVGVLGVAGSTYQAAAPGAWWWSGEQHQRMNILHSPPGQQPSLDCLNPGQYQLEDVAVLDGVWLCTRRDVWQQLRFDQHTFGEFHLYDVDYCTAVYQRFRVCLTYEVLLEHYSKGSVNDMWVRNMTKYEHKWQGKLPFGPAKVAPAEKHRITREELFKFVQLLPDSTLSPASKLWYLGRLFTYTPISRDYFWLARQLLRRAIR